jgi:hypothetical protein
LKFLSKNILIVATHLFKKKMCLDLIQICYKTTFTIIGINVSCSLGEIWYGEKYKIWSKKYETHRDSTQNIVATVPKQCGTYTNTNTYFKMARIDASLYAVI